MLRQLYGPTNIPRRHKIPTKLCEITTELYELCALLGLNITKHCFNNLHNLYGEAVAK